MSALMDEFKKDEAPPQSTNKMMSKLMGGIGHKPGLKGMIGMAQASKQKKISLGADFFDNLHDEILTSPKDSDRPDQQF